MLLKEKIEVMGVGIHPLTLEEAVAAIAGWIGISRQRFMRTKMQAGHIG